MPADCVVAAFAHVFSMVTVDLAGDLRRQIAAKQVVCFVGAGVRWRRRVAGPGRATLWPRADRERRALGAQRSIPISAGGWVDDRLRALASDDIDDLLAGASQVASKLGAPDGGEYANGCIAASVARVAMERGLIEALGALDVPIVTTNYDHLLEKVLHRDAVSWPRGRRRSHLARRLERHPAPARPLLAAGVGGARAVGVRRPRRQRAHAGGDARARHGQEHSVHGFRRGAARPQLPSVPALDAPGVVDHALSPLSPGARLGGGGDAGDHIPPSA